MSIRGRWTDAFLSFGLLLCLCLAPTIALAQKQVLFIFDEDQNLPGLSAINRALREVLTQDLKDGVEIYTESLNLSKFSSGDYYDALRQHFRRKYAGKRLDLIVAVMAPSLNFISRYRDELFPGTPIVFCGADASDIEVKQLKPNTTGILVRRAYGPTVEVALKLQPDTKNVFVVGGSSQFDRRLQAMAQRDYEPFKDRVAFTYLTNLSMEDLLKTVSHLPPKSIVICLTLFTDAAGRAFTPHDAVSQISRASNAPVYVSLDQYMGLGPVGGHVYSFDMHARRAAEIALRVLHGEPASSIQVVESATYQNMFDWPELKRWHLPESRIPENSTIINHETSLWEMYKWYILIGLALLMVQSALIVGLLVNRSLRLRAETAMKIAEQRRNEAQVEAKRQREELAHALRINTLGELTASLAHDLLQPLTAIITNSQAAQRFLRGSDEKRLEYMAEALEDVVSAGSQAAETIQRVRAMFRKEHVALTAINVNALIEDMLRLLRTDMQSKGIAVRFNPEKHMPRVEGDAVQLRQVLMNLLVNAEEAVSQANEPLREINIETNLVDSSNIHISVCDTGIGVSENDLERIFDRFVTTKSNGLGMGLAISRSIVEAHGGRIWATRNSDRGLTMHVEIPCHADGDASIERSRVSLPRAKRPSITSSLY